ncbi:fetal and adult testis-expressed transcript protein [Trichechus inunguis]
MAGGPLSLKEEIEVSMAEELCPGGQEQSQDHPVMIEMVDRGSRSQGSASHRRQKLEHKAAGSSAVPPAWNTTRPKKAGSRGAKEPGHGDVRAQEFPGGFQGMRFQYERPDVDLMAEIGLEELNGLEMEVMRRQLRVITERLQDLEEQASTWHYRETLFFTIMVSGCMANLWLWMRR